MMGTYPNPIVYGVSGEHTRGIAGAQNRRQIMCLVHVIKEHSEVWLATVERLAQALEAIRGHGWSVVVVKLPGVLPVYGHHQFGFKPRCMGYDHR